MSHPSPHIDEVRRVVRRSIATVSLSGTLEEKLVAIAAAGFDGLELFEPDLIASPAPPREIAARAADLGLRIELYQPFRDFEAVLPSQLGNGLRKAAAKFALMRDLGSDLMLVCSNVSPDAIDDKDLAAAQLYALAGLAADNGIRLAYEALAWGTHVRHYADAWDIVRRADHPALGLCLDTFHLFTARDSLAPIGQIDPRALFFAQLADAPGMGMDVLQLSRHHRSFPGQGVFDLPGFMAAVLRAGYAGPWSIEVFSDTVREAPAEVSAQDAMRSLLWLEDVTGARLEGEPPAAAVVAVRPARLPQVPKVSGVAFVEVAVPGPEAGVGSGSSSDPAGELGAMLAALGFSRIGKHRSKRVTLWAQGDIRIVLNGERPAPGQPSVAAIGVSTPDPGDAVRRALGLRWPIDRPAHGPGEAELAAITTPMGLDLIFCTDTGPQAWRDDFADDSPSPGVGSGVGLDSIDHLGGSVPVDLYDAETSLYRTLLGMAVGPTAEFNQPHGQMRSRALVSRDATLRIAISAEVLGRQHAPGLQQIALRTADAARTVRLLRESGVPMLDIPGNYYDDLAARHDLPPDRLDLMRSLGLLYDRSGAGEFLHAYTRSVGGMFFELVQRDGDYAGYGESDTPVRLALQD